MKLPIWLISELDSTGLSWRIEEGSKHLKVFVGERQALVLNRGTHGGDKRRFNLSAIRRAARAEMGGRQ
jgi:hypothetical protein